MNGHCPQHSHTGQGLCPVCGRDPFRLHINSDHDANGESRGEDSRPASCSSISLNLLGDPNKPHDICKSDYDKLKDAGFLWEFYPEAPDVFPTNGEVKHDEGN